ncbi:hypothetical protein QQZ08_000266 [Neonectria magnoliae]|uniref:Uncharacterized protein n=1 Tax=Neonectria magnoliae TaxID=2732573 RepID=A0ABR1IKE9_9HYPO
MANILPRSVIRTMQGLESQGGARRRNENPADGVEKKDDSSSQKNKNDGASNSAEKRDDGPSDAEGTYKPTPIDVVVVRVMLTRGIKLPPDVVDMVFDHAEYWPHSSNEIDFMAEHHDRLRVQGTSPNHDKFLLRSYPVGLTGLPDKKDLAEELAWDTNEAKPQPLGREHDAQFFEKLPNYPTPKLVSPVRKIVFSIRSADQGWGGERGNRGTYKGSSTWFEAGLERFDADQACDPQCTYDVRYQSPSSKASPLPVCALRPLHPTLEADPEHEGKFKYNHPLTHNENYEIQRNKTATRAYQDHVVTWSYSDNVKSTSQAAMEIDEEQGRGRGTLDGSFVRNLKLGDVLTIWAKARYAGWSNNIEKVKVEVYWAV